MSTLGCVMDRELSVFDQLSVFTQISSLVASAVELSGSQKPEADANELDSRL